MPMFNQILTIMKEERTKALLNQKDLLGDAVLEGIFDDASYTIGNSSVYVDAVGFVCHKPCYVLYRTDTNFVWCHFVDNGTAISKWNEIEDRLDHLCDDGNIDIEIERRFALNGMSYCLNFYFKD